MGLLNLYRKAKLSSIIGKAIDKPEVMKDEKYWLNFYKQIWAIKETRQMLQGYKTYIIAALTAVLTLLKSLGKIDEATYQTLIALLGSGAVATVAAKINRMNK